MQSVVQAHKVDENKINESSAQKRDLNDICREMDLFPNLNIFFMDSS